MNRNKKRILLLFYLKAVLIAGIIVVFGAYHYSRLHAQAGVEAKVAEPRNSVGYTPLMQAIVAGNRELVRQLIAQGADVNAVANDRYGMSALELAVFNGNDSNIVQIVEMLLKAGARTSFQDVQGDTPLHQVINVTPPGGSEKVAALLLEYQAPINIQNLQNGNTPMHSIVQVPQLDLAKYMFNTFGPMMDLSIKNKFGYTVVDLARLNVVSDVLNPYLERHGQQFGKDDPNKRNILGLTGLMLAIMRNDYSFAKRLITVSDANVNEQAHNRYGNYPLQFACMRGNNVLPYVTLLLNHGANPRLANKDGDTPLHMVFAIASLKERKAVARLLLRRGAYLLATNNDGNTPIHLAVIKKDVDMVTFFQKELGTWVKNKKGLTAQELAIAEHLRVLR